MVRFIVGIDEVGRGPLAGPLTVCAISTSSDSKRGKNFLDCFKDSKKLSPKKRLELFKKAIDARKNGLISFSVSSVSAPLVDRLGISKSVKLAIGRVLKRLNLSPEECKVLLDGSLKAPAEYVFQETIIKGDSKIKIISCASVIAKVRRDRFMIKMARSHKEYKFENHKGYGTKEHFKALKKYGLSKIHRKSFLTKIL